MIEVDHLTRRYGATLAVDDLSFSVQPGRVTGFVGPNGAGKSTTLRLILGLDRPDRGTATIAGAPYATLVHPLRTVGALLDASGVHPGLRASDHLRWLARSNDVPETRIPKLLELVGLADAKRRRVGGYSLGMRQRLGLAAALLGDPPLLVLDEPVNGLDPEGIRWIRTFMKRCAAEGRTVLVSSHLMSELEDTADHVLVLARGRLLADAPLRELVGDRRLEDVYFELTR